MAIGFAAEKNAQTNRGEPAPTSLAMRFGNWVMVQLARIPADGFWLTALSFSCDVFSARELQPEPRR